MLERHDRLETLRKLKELQERIAELAYLLTVEEPAAWTPRVDPVSYTHLTLPTKA